VYSFGSFGLYRGENLLFSTSYASKPFSPRNKLEIRLVAEFYCEFRKSHTPVQSVAGKICCFFCGYRRYRCDESAGFFLPLVVKSFVNRPSSLYKWQSLSSVIQRIMKIRLPHNRPAKKMLSGRFTAIRCV